MDILLPLKLVKRALFKDRRAEIGAQFSQEILGSHQMELVDVGAARGLQPHWKVFEQTSRICLIEPNPDEHAELKALYGYLGDRVAYVEEAVSEKGGDTTLYVTNSVTGSSLLKPATEGWSDYVNPSDFFPLKEVSIKTRTLGGLLDNLKRGNDLVKIDVQGAELQVLKGLGEERLKNLLCLEVEIGMPGGYEGQATLGDVQSFLEKYDVTLFDMRVARVNRPKNNDHFYYQRQIFNVCDDSPTLSWRIWEVDAVFLKNPAAVLKSKNEDWLRRLVVIFCGYGFFTEAYAVVEGASFLNPDEQRRLLGVIIDWHKTQHVSFLYGRSAIAKALRSILIRLAPKNSRRWMQYCYYPYPQG